MTKIFSSFFACIALLLLFHGAFAQTGNNLVLLSNWDNPNLPAISGLVYNEIWGWADGIGNEYAIIGSLQRTYFIDITNPANPIVRDSVQGRFGGCIHRDFKTYRKYCYGVADEGSSSLQIIDMSFLPDSVHVVYDSNQFFVRAHNIFIDSVAKRIYAVGTNTQPNGVIVLSIANNPEVPTLLASVNLGMYTHDLYVKGDTAYMNNGNDGFFIYNFANPAAPVQIAALTSYPQQGYNHSCWLTQNGSHLVMCDETRNKSCKVVDVSNFGNLSVVSMFRSALLGPADTSSIPHNPLIAGNYVCVSYYHDGVQMWDISNPLNPVHVAGYDTEPANTNYNNWLGSWGVYPFLPSGTLIASDVTNGLFVFRVPFPFPRPITAAVQTTNSSCANGNNGSAVVNPAGGTPPYTYSWSGGQTVSNPSGLAPGSYTVTITDRYGYNITQTVTILSPPNLTTSFVVTGESCAGTADGAIDLTCNGGTPPYAFLWSTGDQVEDINGLTGGMYYVTVTDSLGCVWTDSAFVPVIGVTPSSYAGRDTSICISSYQLAASPPPFGQGSWQVIGGPGTVLNPATPNSMVMGMGPGTNTLVWVVSNGQCSGKDTLLVVVSPAAFAFAGRDTAFCGTGIQMSAGNPSPGTGAWSSVQGSINFSPVNAPDAWAIGFASGPYQLIWTVTDGPCTGSDTVTINAGAAPVAAFNYSIGGMTVNFTDQSGNAAYWFWDFGDGSTSSQQHPVHVYAFQGSYFVCLTVEDSCGLDSICHVVTVGTSSTATSSESQFLVWPNPAGDLLNIQLRGCEEGDAALFVCDAQGKILMRAAIILSQGKSDFQVRLEDMPAGLLMLELRSSEGVLNRKIIHYSK